MDTIHVVAVIEAKKGMREKILEVFHQNASIVREEKGCVEYTATVDTNDVGALQSPLEGFREHVLAVSDGVPLMYLKRVMLVGLRRRAARHRTLPPVIRIVNWKGCLEISVERIPLQRNFALYRWRIHTQCTLRRVSVVIHRATWRMDYQHSALPRGRDHLVHPRSHLRNSIRGNLTTHGVPHVANDDGRLAGVPCHRSIPQSKRPFTHRNRNM